MRPTKASDPELHADDVGDDVPADDFADVYQAYLVPVWRYVRSRIWGYHDSQDVTAEVFTRAWKSWPGYNPRRGPVAPWLFRIAQRTIADWYRRRPSDTPAAPESSDLQQLSGSVLDGLDKALLDRELLTGLGWALAQLSDRDRHCVALRFAGELKLAEIAEVLGVSTPAAKMALSRALRRLADVMAQLDQERTVEEQSEADLDGMVEALVVGGHPAVASQRLQELMMHVSALHQPSMPPELPARLAACIACAKRFNAGHPTGPGRGQGGASGADLGGIRGFLANRLGLGALVPVGWAALAPICLACTIPMFLAPFMALGLTFGLILGLHLIAVAAAPLVFWVLWRHFNRHRDHLAVWVGGIGALALLIHLPLHFFIHGEGGPLLFTVSDQLGTVLLLVGALLDWRAMRRWISRQRARMTMLAPAVAAAA